MNAQGVPAPEPRVAPTWQGQHGPDALEQRDPWRTAWNWATGDVAVIALTAVVLAAALSQMLLPQIPPGGSANAAAFSAWQATARTQTAAAYPLLLGAGLFDVAHSPWLRAATAALIVLLGVRLIDRAVRLMRVVSRLPEPRLTEEYRARVVVDGEALDGIAGALASGGFRTAGDGATWVAADRGPIAAGLSFLMHAGLLVSAAGAMVNLLLGWAMPLAPVSLASPAVLPDGAQLTMLTSDAQKDTTELRTSHGAAMKLSSAVLADRNAAAGSLLDAAIMLRVVELNPEVRLAVVAAGGNPLTITASSYADPQTEVVQSLSAGEPERLFAVEAARIAVQLSADQGGRVRAFELPSGRSVVDAPISPQVAAGEVTLLLNRVDGVVVDARYRPGLPLLQLGVLPALAGMIGALWRPMQTVIVRRRDGWIEYYGAGRGVGRAIRAL